MSWSNDKARKINKFNGSELYDKYLTDEEEGGRHALKGMTQYSSCYYLCLTPNYRKVKRFTCDNCYFRVWNGGGEVPDYLLSEYEGNCPDFFKDEYIDKYNLVSMRRQNMGCIMGKPFKGYYDISDKLFVEIFKVKEGEYWIRYNKEAHNLWSDVYVSTEYNCGRVDVKCGR